MNEIPEGHYKELVPREGTFDFAMRHNGFLRGNIGWTFDSEILGEMTNENRALRVAMFGPSERQVPFFYSEQPDLRQTASSLSQPKVLETIEKFRKTDKYQAGRIAYVLGGIARDLNESFGVNETEIDESVAFAAHMTGFGDNKSADAIAASMAMYVISGGDIDQDKRFEGHVYHMADAIAEDDIIPVQTADLGLSQAMRIRSFIDKIQGKEPRQYPSIAEDLALVQDFPTVGAEFHFPPDAPDKYPYFWQRLALLNMAQFQLGNFVQFSRDDRDVIEVRMNPSVYPVAIATWNHMRYILPELNEAYFTATFNRDEENFDWKDVSDKILLKRLRGLGLLSYASIYKSNPHQDSIEEINFGANYLGQTVKMVDGRFDFSGIWGGGDGKFGQFGIYAGYGNNFPYLAYYTSMALAQPEILLPVSLPLYNVEGVDDALSMHSEKRKLIFENILEEIAEDPHLSAVSEAGVRIVEELAP